MSNINDFKGNTKEQLLRKIEKAPVFVPRDKEYKGVYFDDKGLRLEVTDDYAVIGTMFHRHVFNKITAGGYSKPYVYVDMFIGIALDNDCTVKDESGNVTRSYSLLFEKLKAKEDKGDYHVCWYVDLWLNNIIRPLYSIDANAMSQFITYEQYLHGIAVDVTLNEGLDNKAGMTNKEFVESVIEKVRKYTENIEETKVVVPHDDAVNDKEVADALNGVITDSVVDGMAKGRKEVVE